MQSLYKKSILTLSIVCFQAIASEEQPIAIIGGYDGTKAYAAFVNSNTNTAGPNLTNLPTAAGSRIFGVAINNEGQAIIAGINELPTSTSYAAFVNIKTNAAEAPVSGLLTSMGTGALLGTAINDFNQAIVGGISPASAEAKLYAAFVEISTNAANAPITGFPTSGDSNTNINAVTINNANQVLAAGSYLNTPYATRINPATNSTAATPISNLPGSGDQLHGCSLNQSGLGLLGGRDSPNNIAYAAFIQPNTNTASTPISPLPVGGIIYAVALNSSGRGIIGGAGGGGGAYAAFVDPITNIASPISNLPTNLSSQISGVAINDFGQALIGGSDGTKAYAVFIDPLTNTASDPIKNLPTTSGSKILSVALIMNPRISINGLKGNNLIFANYINDNAQKDAFYFIPAYLNGELADALESAAPTRNALSLFAADDNMFSLNHGLSFHLRNNRHFRNRTHHRTQPNQEVAMFFEPSRNTLQLTDENLMNEEPYHEFIANASVDSFTEPQIAAKKKTSLASEKCSNLKMDQPYTLWFEGIGAFASQKAQHQTVGFNPSMGGFILAFDGKANQKTQVGGGLAYTFTHIHEHKDAGYSHINQEYLFVYATWSNHQFYFDGALWGGCFQIDQVRNIDVSGFHFQSASDPIGWQLSPHMEFGYDYTIIDSKKEREYVIDPFIMLDCVNAWEQAFKEEGVSPFNSKQPSHYSSFLRTEASVRFYETFTFDTWRLVLEEKAGYVNKTPFGVGTVNGALVGSPGSFTLETLSNSQNLGVAEMAFIFEPTSHAYPYGSLSYQGEFNGDYQSHQAMLEVSWNF